MELDLTLDRDDELPVGTQLAWRLRGAILTGVLRPGDRLPGVRELAELAGVNVNTVRTVYGRLHEAAILTSRPGHGTFVADRGPEREVLPPLVGQVRAAARRAGIEPRDLAVALLYGPAPAATSVPPPSDPTERRHRLRAQIARLEAELARERTRPGDGPSPALATSGVRMLTEDELTERRDRLVERLAAHREDREELVGRTREGLAELAAEVERPPTPRAPRVQAHLGSWVLQWKMA